MAGIYIPNMQMPIGHNEASFGIDADGHPICIVYTENTVEPEIYDVIPVPDHERLIEADKVKAYMLNGHYKYRMVVSWQDILEAPTIIPADTNKINKEEQHD